METTKEGTSKDSFQVEKLTEKNYKMWKVLMEAVLDQREVLGVVNGSEAPILALTMEQQEGLSTRGKDEREKMVEQRIKKEKLAKATILSCISDSQLLHVATLKTAAEMWAKFAALYENRKMGTKLFLRKRLLDLKMEEGSSMHDHIANFQSLCDQLATLGVGLENEEANLIFLNSLPSSYGEFVAIISAFINEETSIAHVTSMLLQEELRRNRNGGDQRTSRPSEAALLANNAKAKGKWVKKGEGHEDNRQREPSDRKKEKCNYCKKQGHEEASCWKKYWDDNHRKNVANLVFVPPHPVIRHFLSVLRNEVTPSRIFWGALAELGRYLIYEAARDWLSTVEGQVKTPCGVAKAEYLSERDTVKVVPILRAGLVLIENMHSILPFTQTYHIGYAENDNGKEPTLYLNKFPDRFPEGAKFLIADAMLATGACLRRTIDLLKRRNVDHRMIRVVSAVATPEALRSLNDKYPGLRVYIGSIDEGVDERGHIVPGIGDVESRCFGS